MISISLCCAGFTPSHTQFFGQFHFFRKLFTAKLIEIGGRQPAHAHLQVPEGRRSMFPDWVWSYTDAMLPYYRMGVEGFHAPMTPAEKRTWDQYMGDLQTYILESQGKFINGELPLTRFDEYTATLKRLGIDEIAKLLDIRQARYMQMKADYEKK